jgi:preprotein translocase subunit SecA
LVRLNLHGRSRDGLARPPAVGSKAGADEILRWCRTIVASAAELESAAEACSADELRARTRAYRERLSAGQPAADLLPEAFATMREAARRTIGLRHHDVQIIGGAVLTLGKIAEMRTGEGKTLTATLPAYLAALAGQNVHVLTANDYLADRDFAWMRPVYELLGLSVSLLRADENPDLTARRQAYGSDVTYGSAGQFCYDFLRDNLAWKEAERVQGRLDLAIVDEADLVLVDEMVTTPQISAPAQGPKVLIEEFARVVARLRPGVDYVADPQVQRVHLSDHGTDRIERWLELTNLYEERNAAIVQLIENALRAKELYSRDQEYTINDTDVVVVDSVSGRPQPGRRFADGLHEAIEAKEGLPVRPATQLLASISVRDYLSQYATLAGLTGTAVSDAQVYREIYHLDVVSIPTNRPMIRIDHPDVLYRTRQAKLAALAGDTSRRQAAGQPVLIGTLSTDDGQIISRLLDELGTRHELLSASNYEREAEILAEAGRPGAVTIVVKMAGRGVDIVLGGAQGTHYEAVATAGGLCVLGAERSASRRMELHLRGRAGRQGDPGASRFYVSADDAVLASTTKLPFTMLPEGSEFRRMAMAIDNIQARTAESQATWLSQNAAFDDVLAQQRRLVYADRCTVLEEPDLRERITRMIHDVVRSGAVSADAVSAYERREAELGRPAMREFERRALLAAIDWTWREHLAAMTDLLTALKVRAVGRSVSLPEYQREAARLFEEMTATLLQRAVNTLLTVKLEA